MEPAWNPPPCPIPAEAGAASARDTIPTSARLMLRLLHSRLAGAAAAVVFFLAQLDALLEVLGNRGARLANLPAGIAGGRAYLAASALGFGASGLTFYDRLRRGLLRAARRGPGRRLRHRARPLGRRRPCYHRAESHSARGGRPDDELFCKATPSPAITAVVAPAGIDSEKIAAAFSEAHNITIAGGRGEMKGKIFRLGHMGCTAECDTNSALAALEQVLADLGQPVDFGAGLRAAQKVFAEKP